MLMNACARAVGLLSLVDEMGRFERAYLGCKNDVEYWPAFIFLVIPLLDYGFYPPAHDPTNGGLLPALNCDVGVLGVVVVGGILTDQLSKCLVGYVHHRWPRHAISGIGNVRSHYSSTVILLMWVRLGWFALSGVAGWGVVVEEQVEKIRGKG